MFCNLFSIFSNSVRPSPSAQNQPNTVFSGSIASILEKDQQKGLSAISRLEVCGPDHPTLPGFHTSESPSVKDVKSLMLVVNKNKNIQELSFIRCTLKPEHGAVIGAAIIWNRSLRLLDVHSIQLGETGMSHLMGGLRHNESIEIFRAHSYIHSMFEWNPQSAYELAEVVKGNSKLKKIELVYNQINTKYWEQTMNILIEPYEKTTDKGLASIQMSDGGLGLILFNRENVLNESLAIKANIVTWYNKKSKM